MPIHLGTLQRRATAPPPLPLCVGKVAWSPGCSGRKGPCFADPECPPQAEEGLPFPPAFHLHGHSSLPRQQSQDPMHGPDSCKEKTPHPSHFLADHSRKQMHTSVIPQLTLDCLGTFRERHLTLDCLDTAATASKGTFQESTPGILL